jgi:hypothetical protein
MTEERAALASLVRILLALRRQLRHEVAKGNGLVTPNLAPLLKAAGCRKQDLASLQAAIDWIDARLNTVRAVHKAVDALVRMERLLRPPSGRPAK